MSENNFNTLYSPSKTAKKTSPFELYIEEPNQILEKEFNLFNFEPIQEQNLFECREQEFIGNEEETFEIESVLNKFSLKNIESESNEILSILSNNQNNNVSSPCNRKSNVSALSSNSPRKIIQLKGKIITNNSHSRNSNETETDSQYINICASPERVRKPMVNNICLSQFKSI
jgi:hypothetical protein